MKIMHPLYLIRHAQSRANVAELKALQMKADFRASGHMWDLALADPRITSNGHQQVQSQKRNAQKLPVRKIFVSPLKRTLETCAGLFSEHQKKPEIVVCPWLTEHMGTISETSLLGNQPDPEFHHFDWSLFLQLRSRYWLSEVIVSHKFQELKSLFKDVDSFLRLLAGKMEEVYPEPLEETTDMNFRCGKLRDMLKEELKLGPVALVGHRSYFSHFTYLQTGSSVYLDNCEIVKRELA